MAQQFTYPFIYQTDSYKPGHWPDYPDETVGVYSYWESRNGADYPYTEVFGIQGVLKQHLEGVVVTQEDIEDADAFFAQHFGDATIFNRKGWERIVNVHGGKLPLHIKAVKEGMRIPTSNVIMTVENTDPECYWLTNYAESLLTHIWYPSTVATRSASVRDMIVAAVLESGGTAEDANFMLHDFGFRGVETTDAGGIGGAGHLLNFLGTDTLPALYFIRKLYGMGDECVGFSVVATEHSVMTAEGRYAEVDGEQINGDIKVLDKLIKDHPTGILSVVADSYDIYEFTRAVCERKDVLVIREGRFVERPDSTTPEHPTPESLVLWIVKELWNTFGGEVTETGFRLLDTHVRVLWGDGIEDEGIKKILDTLMDNGFAAQNMVFGMGGGLLQKLNRDTQRFAFKCSAQRREGEDWRDISKNPLDQSKKSKAGRLALIQDAEGNFKTIREDELTEDDTNLLETVFLNGEVTREEAFDVIRARAMAY